MGLIFRAGAWLCLSLLAPGVLTSLPRAVAADLARPEGEILLLVSGDIERRNGPAGAEFDRAMLEGLGVATLRTSTPWTEGVPEFRGVPARAVLDHVGARGSIVQAIAINDYSAEIPVAELRDGGVLIAAEMNGKALDVRDKGPLWIVYPLDDLASGRDRRIERKMVWQLFELRVQ